MDWNSIVSVILGAVLAIITTFATRLFTDWYDRYTKRSQVKRFLAVELISCISRIDALISVYKQSQLPDPTLLSALERATKLFVTHREATYLLDVQTSQIILTFYDSIDHAVEMTLSMLRLAQNTEHEGFALKEIDKQMLNLNEACLLGERIIQRLSIGNNEKPRLLENENLNS